MSSRSILPSLVLAGLVLSGCESSTVPTASGEPLVAPSSTAPSLSRGDAHVTRLVGVVADPAQGETDATGRATLRCVRGGTLLTAHFTGLAPKGVYTIWIIGNAGFASGAAGPSDGSKNWFRASGDRGEHSFRESEGGEGELSLLVRPGDQGSFNGLNWSGCIDSSSLKVLVLDGHTDGLTHGGRPGPNNYDAMLFFP